MTIVRLDVAPWGARLASPVGNARRRWTVRRGVLLRLEDEQGQVGVGEASPLPGYSPDRLGACAVALRRLDPSRDLLAQVDQRLPAARFAVETALAELRGEPIVVPGVAGPAVVVEDAEDARWAVEAGARVVKVKVGAMAGPPPRPSPRFAERGSRRAGWIDRDLERVAEVRAAVGDAVELRVDANGVLSVAEADALIAALAPLRPAWIEEPVPLALIEQLAPAAVPIAVDESLAMAGGPERALELVRAGRVSVLVLKPTTLGGLGRCRELARLAGEAGGRAALSHCFEGPVARAAIDVAGGTGRSAGWSVSGAPGRWEQETGNRQQETGNRKPRGREEMGWEQETGNRKQETGNRKPREREAGGWERETGEMKQRGRGEEAGVAVVVDGRGYGWEEIEQRVRVEIRAVRGHGARRGDPFAVTAYRDLETVVRLHALWELGAVALLLDPELAPGERAERIARAAGCRVDGGGAIVFTSGSTGRPRGVILPWAALAGSAAASAANLGWRDGDRWLCCLPLHHVGGLSILVRTRLARRCTVLATGPLDAASIAALIDRERVTLASLVPTQLHRLVDAGWSAPPHLRAILLGGAAATPALLARAAARRLPVLRTYGMSETASQICTDRAPGADPATGVPPLPGVELAIAGDGRIRVRGPMVCAGYLPPDRADVDATGWLTTSDRGALDADGSLHVLGRADDVIVSGGENVDPLQVEAALAELPGVRAACVFAVPDPELGQLVAAALVGDHLDAARLRAAIAARLNGARRPRRLCVVPALPLGPGGKLDRAAAARLAAPLLRPI